MGPPNRSACLFSLTYISRLLISRISFSVHIYKPPLPLSLCSIPLIWLCRSTRREVRKPTDYVSTENYFWLFCEGLNVVFMPCFISSITAWFSSHRKDWWRGSNFPKEKRKIDYEIFFIPFSFGGFRPCILNLWSSFIICCFAFLFVFRFYIGHFKKGRWTYYVYAISGNRGLDGKNVDLS